MNERTGYQNPRNTSDFGILLSQKIVSGGDLNGHVAHPQGVRSLSVFTVALDMGAVSQKETQS